MADTTTAAKEETDDKSRSANSDIGIPQIAQSDAVAAEVNKGRGENESPGPIIPGAGILRSASAAVGDTVSQTARQVGKRTTRRSTS